MSEKSFKTVTQSLSKGLAQFRAEVPEVQAGFSALHQASMKDGALDAKTKELIALGIGVAARCDGCIAVHADAALKQGASRAEIADALGVAVAMNAGAAMVYSARVLDAIDR